MAKIAVIGSQAFALLNFRAPLLAAMVAKGHEVVAFAPDFSDMHRQTLASMGVHAASYPLARNGLNPFSDIRTFLALTGALRRGRFDVVFAFTIKPVIYGLVGGCLAGVKRRYALITGLGYTLAGDGGAPSRAHAVVRSLARNLYRLALSVASGVFMQNPDDAKAFVSSRLVPSEKIRGIIPTGVDLSDWQASPPFFTPPTFSVVARMLRDKGIVEFVTAARRVKRQHPEVRFLLVGDTDSNPRALTRAELESFVEDGAVEWLGHMPVKPILTHTSVFVLPSYHEGLPRSTQEAMAMALPVITTDVPGCRQTVVDGENGFLIPARDPDALASAMLRFIDNPMLIGEMGARSRTLAEERFDVRKSNAAILSAMEL